MAIRGIYGAEPRWAHQRKQGIRGIFKVRDGYGAEPLVRVDAFEAFFRQRPALREGPVSLLVAAKRQRLLVKAAVWKEG